MKNGYAEKAAVMPTVAQVKVVPEALRTTWGKLRDRVLAEGGDHGGRGR